MTIGIQITIEDPIFNSFGYITEVELLSHTVILFFFKILGNTIKVHIGCGAI